MKRLRRALLVLLAVCIAAAALALGISGWMVVHERARTLTVESEPPEALDAILVLGCGVDAQGRPKPMLRDRMAVAVRLYQQGWADTLLLSGDNSGPAYNEVGAMQSYALAHGVPQAALRLDNEGFNTDASVRRAKEVYGVHRMAVVTQAYHLPRALYLAEAYGLAAWGVSATLHDYGPKQPIWSLREILARDKDFLRLAILPG